MSESLIPIIGFEPVRRLMDVALRAGGEARVVGGAVRDALLDRKVGEIDFASTLMPDALAATMKSAGIKTVPTGLIHGTITVVIDGKGYEVTTLRHDVETDGRRAKVAFTDDWQADAARRDFTINALYVDGNGKLYDYFDGQKDLRAGRVRFIGDAEARIREDVLRILRFFRFTAWFGKGEADKDGLAACHKLAELVPQLSVERVWREIVKLLAADNPAMAWQLMVDAGVLAKTLPEAVDVKRLESLLKVEKKYEKPANSLRRLAALLEITREHTGGIPLPLAGGVRGGLVNTNAVGTSPPSVPPASGREARPALMATTIAQRLKLSKREAARLQQLTTLPALLSSKLDPVPFRRALYEYGVEDAADAALLCAAAHPEIDLEPALMAAAEWDNPQFPLQGQDLLKLGFKPGPTMGAALQQLEQQWIAGDFKPARDELLTAANKLQK